MAPHYVIWLPAVGPLQPALQAQRRRAGADPSGAAEAVTEQVVLHPGLDFGQVRVRVTVRNRGGPITCGPAQRVRPGERDMSDDSERHPMRVLLLVLLVALVGVLAYGVVRFDWLQRPDSAVETVAGWTEPPLEEEAALDVDEPPATSAVATTTTPEPLEGAVAAIGAQEPARDRSRVGGAAVDARCGESARGSGAGLGRAAGGAGCAGTRPCR